jgi:AraC-like DNA-binding protein
VENFVAPLSLKSMIRGEGEWRVGRGTFQLDSGSILIVNDRQPYSMRVDGPAESFCLFSETGFVEGAVRAVETQHGRLLDDPAGHAAPVGFFERPWPKSERIARLLSGIRRSQSGPGTAPAGLAECAELVLLGEALAELATGARDERDRVKALRAGTREELYRRLLIGRAALARDLELPMTLAEAAREACLSPFHFHRSFQAVFGEAPLAFRTRLRLERAARLLRESNEPVTELSLRAGYQSLGTFSATFHERFGLSPSAYRARFS